MGLKNVVQRVADKAANRVAKLSALSSEQVQAVQLLREDYLLEMPDPTGATITERMMAASSIEIFNAYLSQIKELYLPIEKEAEYGENFRIGANIKYFNITKWVTDPKENNLEKLVNVYAVLADEDCNIALVFNRTKSTTNVYLAVVNTKNAEGNTDADIYKDRLIEAIRGNFPGAELKNESMGIIPCLKNDKKYSVATASNIPAEKSEKFISQTIEKLLDGIIPTSKESEYTIVLLATPIQDVEERKMRLGELYSGLAPYASWQTDYHFMDNKSFGSSATIGVNVGASAGIQNGNNYSVTDSENTTDSTSTTDTRSNSDTLSDGTSKADSSSSSHTDGINETDTTSKGDNWSKSNGKTETEGHTDSKTDTEGKSHGTSSDVHVNASVTAEAGAIFAKASATVGVTAGGSVSNGTNSSHADSVSDMWNKAESFTDTKGGFESAAKAIGKNAADTLTNGITNTISKSVAKTTGTAIANTVGRAVTKGMAATRGIAKSVNYGVNFGANFARSSTVTAMVGKTEGITQSFTNFNIKHALELLETQMKRLEQSTALGMWDFAAYVLSEDQNIANNVAHSYLALTLGEDSYMSRSAVNLWRGSVPEERDAAKIISDYIREFRHPVFGLNPQIVNDDPEYSEYPPIVTATATLSGKELAYSLNFPQKSVPGLPVLECAGFGRNIVTYDDTGSNEKKLRLGKIFHMNHEENNPAELSLESLKSHTFITGSTGAGKSNTVYQMLDRARDAGIHFLVIEPAKGEYKNVFGNNDKVKVYGTNPLLSSLLRIDPFSFPDKIHILEHLDRLVELFNVCWPMYAAMPAVLKSAVEKAYTDCGWDLVTSKNKYDTKIYPDFRSVARNIKTIIDTSEYDNENKGAYKGSLLTRLQSLTNGINGMLFSSNELSGKELFDDNVIIDLSRVGSSETKSLIMGMLVLKLQEYRMTSGIPMNADIRHITVLEEAHNLLKRTSVEHSSESSNILGKSVEMIANAIAEMRTYGEGFIIADQAPGLMDMSVIRNTNTKIIMRLPDQSDRELVGRAANLNDDQIKELAKLPRGVAAIYQNEWVQPILCKVDRFDTQDSLYTFDPAGNNHLFNDCDNVSESLLKCIMDKELFSIGDKQDLRELKSRIIRSGIEPVVKVEFLDYLAAEKEDGLDRLRCLMYDFLKADKAIQASENCGEIHEWVNAVIKELDPSVKGYSKKQIDLVTALILQEKTARDPVYADILHRFTEVYRNGGGSF